MSISLSPTFKTLADKMNSTGFIRVIAWQEPSLYKIRHPLIYFDAPLWVAQLMEQALMEAFRRGTDGLKHVWRLMILFDEAAQLKFMLYSPYYGWYSHSTLLSIWRLSVLQKYIIAELSAISEILEKTVFLKLGEFKPKQDDCSGDKDEAE